MLGRRTRAGRTHRSGRCRGPPSPRAAEPIAELRADLAAHLRASFAIRARQPCTRTRKQTSWQGCGCVAQSTSEKIPHPAVRQLFVARPLETARPIAPEVLGAAVRWRKAPG